MPRRHHRAVQQQQRAKRSYSPEQLYEVVASVQHYSQFVPWCVGSHVTVRDQGGTYLEAELHIGFQMISER
jgi:ribosome-associated toxin RatA of RatAB toxin-antitoxin module